MTNIVTPKQTDFINSLLSKREVPESVKALVPQVSTTLEASILIKTLLALPVAVKVAAPAEIVPDAKAEYFAALNAAEVSKYAIPTRYLRNAFPEFGNLLNNDLLFFEVKTYKGRKYFNRLSGAPGAFNRGRVPMATATGLLKFISGRHVEFGKLFSDHYKVCGRCAAELTDHDSRVTGFGPTCRKVFGI